jgi:hypothetical protein
MENPKNEETSIPTTKKHMVKPLIASATKTNIKQIIQEY